MRCLLALLACAALACASLPVPDAFARELVRRDAPRRSFRGEEEIHLGQAALDALRSRISSDGGELVALVVAPQGFHPYVVMLFVSRGDVLEVISTSVYWGVIQAKFVGQFRSGLATKLAQSARKDFDCSTGPTDEPLSGLALVDWRFETQVVCRLNPYTESAGRFGELIQPVLDESKVVYEASE